ncbi:hypothetical protein Z043_120910, partial [Scleropages formosus]
RDLSWAPGNNPSEENRVLARNGARVNQHRPTTLMKSSALSSPAGFVTVIVYLPSSPRSAPSITKLLRVFLLSTLTRPSVSVITCGRSQRWTEGGAVLTELLLSQQKQNETAHSGSGLSRDLHIQPQLVACNDDDGVLVHHASSGVQEVELGRQGECVSVWHKGVISSILSLHIIDGQLVDPGSADQEVRKHSAHAKRYFPSLASSTPSFILKGEAASSFFRKAAGYRASDGTKLVILFLSESQACHHFGPLSSVISGSVPGVAAKDERRCTQPHTLSGEEHKGHAVNTQVP